MQAPEAGSKRLQLLKEALPQVSRVAVLWNANPAFRGKTLEWQNTQDAARVLGVILQSVQVYGPDDFDRAFAEIVKERPDAMIVFTDLLTLSQQERIVAFATRHQLPMLSEGREFAVAGGLMSYGASLGDLYRCFAYYVDRILKGRQASRPPR
jgi:ABC-type uncharacterized transport system substrate-binding protein